MNVEEYYQCERFANTEGFALINFGVSPQELVPNDLMRVALIITPPLGDRVTLFWKGTGGVTDRGIVLYAAGPPLVLNLREHGSLVHGPIFAVTATALTAVHWAASSCHICQASKMSQYTPQPK